MSAVSVLNIIPSYSCNLYCEHCFTSWRKDSICLDIEKLYRILSTLKDEEQEVSSFEIYGGEVSILDTSYLGELFSCIKVTFPDAKITVISNLINPERLYCFLDVISSISTSYEGVRFKPGDSLYKVWCENYEMIKKVKPVDIITCSTPLFDEALDVLREIDFRYITVLQTKIQDNAPDSVTRRIMRYVTSVDTFREHYKKALELWKDKVTFPNFKGVFGMEKVIHVFPDGTFGLPGPSQKGYPYEKNFIFGSSGDSVAYNIKRINYIAHQKTLSPCNICVKQPCLAEFRYPFFCAG